MLTKNHFKVRVLTPLTFSFNFSRIRSTHFVENAAIHPPAKVGGFLAMRALKAHIKGNGTQHPISLDDLERDTGYATKVTGVNAKESAAELLHQGLIRETNGGYLTILNQGQLREFLDLSAKGIENGFRRYEKPKQVA